MFFIRYVALLLAPLGCKMFVPATHSHPLSAIRMRDCVQLVQNWLRTSIWFNHHNGS